MYNCMPGIKLMECYIVLGDEDLIQEETGEESWILP